MDTSKQKPDLMGKPGASADGVKRILAHLEHGAKLPASKPARTGGWSIDGWTLGLGMMLLGMFCIAWLMHDGGSATGGFKQSYGGSASHYADKRATSAVEHTPAVERTPAALARADMPGATLEQPAAIINDPLAHLDATTPPTREASLTNAFGLPAVKAEATARARSGAAATSKDVLPASAAHTKADAAYHGAGGPNSGATNPGAARTDARHHSGAAAARTSATTRTSAGAKTPPANDTDVALLTALVAHAGKPSSTAIERSRDVVERHDSDSTAELLARCKQLGVIEGMLCRSRICSGRWDSDPVCRAPAQ